MALGANYLGQPYLGQGWAGTLVVTPPGTQGATAHVVYQLNRQTRVYVLIGVPPSSLGNNGDYAYRLDKPDGSGVQMYRRSAGAWGAIA